MSRKVTIPEKAAIFLSELESGRLIVAKWIGKEGTYVRGAVEKNAEWYSKFCSLYSHRHSRRYPKVRTFIKRQWTIRALERLKRGENAGLYAARLLAFIESYTRRWIIEYEVVDVRQYAEF